MSKVYTGAHQQPDEVLFIDQCCMAISVPRAEANGMDCIVDSEGRYVPKFPGLTFWRLTPARYAKMNRAISRRSMFRPYLKALRPWVLRTYNLTHKQLAAM